MLLTRAPFILVTLILTSFASSTWAFVAQRQAQPVIPGAAIAPPPITTTVQASHVPGVQPIAPYQYGSGRIVTPTTSAPTIIRPATSGFCTPYQCNVFYQWVTVLYWPQATQNNGCVPQDTGTPLVALPPGIDRNLLKSPSVYIIFPSISANDGCTQIGKTFSSITTSFAPSDVSTIDESTGATKSFNFGDLPCGPPGTHNASYAPLIAPPSFIFNELDNGAFATCIPGLRQGVDPPIAVDSGDAVSEPDGPGHRGANKRVPADALVEPTPVPS